MRDQLLLLTGFAAGTFPMKYLGVPLTPKRWTRTECQALVTKITGKIDGWSAKDLSYAGRKVLVG